MGFFVGLKSVRLRFFFSPEVLLWAIYGPPQVTSFRKMLAASLPDREMTHVRSSPFRPTYFLADY